MWLEKISALFHEEEKTHTKTKRKNRTHTLPPYIWNGPPLKSMQQSLFGLYTQKILAEAAIVFLRGVKKNVQTVYLQFNKTSEPGNMIPLTIHPNGNPVFSQWLNLISLFFNSTSTCQLYLEGNSKVTQVVFW